jgi:predicted short-subunit dehydrogenase-like oxidoreductase (DUF2520 family)
MLAAMRRPSIAIVGPGRLGTALAVSLRRAGYRVDEIVARSDKASFARARALARETASGASLLSTATLEADVVWFCMPDSQIAKVAEQVAAKNWRGRFAFHSSGVLASDVLIPLQLEGAAIASVHPLMTFVEGSSPDLKGVTFAIEGDKSAVKVASDVVRNLKARPASIRKRDKAAYHAFATLICPLLVSLLASAEQAAGLAGVSRNDARKRMLPIVQQTLQNYVRLGPMKAFTGPFVRGDAGTVGMHLAALAKMPAASNVYAGLAQAALELLPSKDQKEMSRLLSVPSSRTSRSLR